MSITLETPEQASVRLAGNGAGATPNTLRSIVAESIRDRDASIAAWCEQKAQEAQREADAHESQITSSRTYEEASAKRERRERCEGQASAFRAIASMLRGKS